MWGGLCLPMESVTVRAGEQLRSMQACPGGWKEPPGGGGGCCPVRKARCCLLSYSPGTAARTPGLGEASFTPTMAQHPGCRTRGSPAREKRWLQAAQEALKGAGWGPQGPGLQRRQSPASLGLLALCLAGDRCLRPVSTTPACPSPAAAHRPFSKTQFSP